MGTERDCEPILFETIALNNADSHLSKNWAKFISELISEVNSSSEIVLLYVRGYGLILMLHVTERFSIYLVNFCAIASISKSNQ